MASEPDEENSTFEVGHRSDLFQPLRQLDGRVVALAGEEMRERQFAHLRCGGLDQLLIAVTERGAPKPRHAFDIGLAFAVVDEHALSALQHQGTALAKGGEIGVGVNQGFDVADGEIAQRHGAMTTWPPRRGADAAAAPG